MLSGQHSDGAKVSGWLRDALNPVEHRPRRPDYDFSDLISLFVVRELRRRGVKISDIRTAEKYLRSKWGTARPFASDEIKTDGRGIFVDDELIAGQVESADRVGQQVMREAVKDRLSRVRYDEGGWATRWSPADSVAVDPDVRFGEPTVIGTRIPTRIVFEMSETTPAEVLAKDFGIEPNQVRAAINFEKQRNAALQN